MSEQGDVVLADFGVAAARMRPVSFVNLNMQAVMATTFVGTVRGGRTSSHSALSHFGEEKKAAHRPASHTGQTESGMLACLRVRDLQHQLHMDAG